MTKTLPPVRNANPPIPQVPATVLPTPPQATVGPSFDPMIATPPVAPDAGIGKARTTIWEMAPKKRRSPIGLTLVTERGPLIETFQAELTALAKAFFPTLDAWQAFRGQSPALSPREAKTTPPDLSFQVWEAASWALQNQQLPDFVSRWPRSTLETPEIAREIFLRKWRDFLPALALTNSLERCLPEQAEFILSQMPPTVRQYFDRIRMAQLTESIVPVCKSMGLKRFSSKELAELNAVLSQNAITAMDATDYTEIPRHLGLNEVEWRLFEGPLSESEKLASRLHLRPGIPSEYPTEPEQRQALATASTKLVIFIQDESSYRERFGKGQTPDITQTPEEIQALFETGTYFDFAARLVQQRRRKLWATPPRNRNQDPELPLFEERGNLIEIFERDFAVFMKRLFPTLESLKRHCALQHPDVFAELPDTEHFTLFAQETAGALLSHQALPKFLRGLADPSWQKLVEFFDKKWRKFLLVLRAVAVVERSESPRATRLLKILTIEGRNTFDWIRAAKPEQTWDAVLQRHPSQGFSLSNFLAQFEAYLQKVSAPKPDLLVPLETNDLLTPEDKALIQELLAVLANLTSEDGKLIREFIEERDLPLWNTLSAKNSVATPQILARALPTSREPFQRIHAALKHFLQDPQMTAIRHRDLGLTPEEWKRFEASLTTLELRLLQDHFKPLAPNATPLPLPSGSLFLASVGIRLMAFLRDEKRYFAEFRKGELPELTLTEAQRLKWSARNPGLAFDKTVQEIEAKFKSPTAQAHRLRILQARDDYDFREAWEEVQKRRRG